ncbi:MAG: hypothetical protein LBV54_06560 [Puniceicoccales bacterium]|nr:hypothetical protein [Puniceicoccales bacterium]
MSFGDLPDASPPKPKHPCQTVCQLSTLPLMNLYANHGRTFIPFSLKREAASVARCSIAGVPPIGVAPDWVDGNTRYFATLGLEDGVDVSLFFTFDCQSQQSPFYFFDGTYKLHDQSSALIQFVVHQQTRGRDTSSALKNELPALGFVFGEPNTEPECPIVEALSNLTIYSEHKVGGVPLFSQIEGDVDAAFDLLRNGYVHLLQLNMPSAATEDTLVDGTWPFGELVFHIFAKKAGGVFSFRYIWA